MPASLFRCPKCRGQLFREPEADSRFALPSEWACLQCGWRQSLSPAQFERTFALTTSTES